MHRDVLALVSLTVLLVGCRSADEARAERCASAVAELQTARSRVREAESRHFHLARTMEETEVELRQARDSAAIEPTAATRAEEAERRLDALRERRRQAAAAVEAERSEAGRLERVVELCTAPRR